MPDYTIDTTTYRKDAVLPVGQGYGVRAGGIAPTSIVIHSTNGNKGSTFEAEAKFLQMSRDVSAHFLVGKVGQIAQVLPPDLMAWHSGQALPAWFNLHSIGIENHHAVGDDWPDAQFKALTWLVRRLMAQYHITQSMIETHRYVALPPGRKSDPDDWSNDSFYAWRSALAPALKLYRVKGVPIYQRQDRTGPRAGYLQTGAQVAIDATYDDGGAHLADGRGFVDLNALEAV